MQLSFLTQWFNNDVLKALAWTFAHSLWQGLFAALLAAVIISTTRRTTAKLRYNLLGAVLILFIATAFITFFIQLQQQKQITASTLQTATTIAGSNAIDSNASAIVPEGFIANLTTWFNNNTDLVLLAWVLFFSLNCLKLLTGLVSVNRLRNYKTHPVTKEWKIKLDQLQNSLGIRQSVNLLQSELIKVPVALGYLKPVILLPFGLLANIPAEQVETILLHELGHIRRRDYLVNFIQHFLEAIFFFNPGMIWISSLLRQEREACCDDIVVANSHQKLNYLNVLVAFQEYSLNHTPYAMAISSKRQYLLNRVKRIVMNENKKLNIFEKSALLFGVILFSAFTYTSQEKQADTIQIAAPVQQLTSKSQSSGSVEKKIILAPSLTPVKREKKRIPVSHKIITDTLPIKKDTLTKFVTEEKKLPLPKYSKNETQDADKALQEIIRIKEQISAGNEVIGKKKEQLEKTEGKNKEEILREIEREREVIERKRGELLRKNGEIERTKGELQRKSEAIERTKGELLRKNGEIERMKGDLERKRAYENLMQEQRNKEREKKQEVKEGARIIDGNKRIKIKPIISYEKRNDVKLEKKEILNIKKENTVTLKKLDVLTSKKSTLFSLHKSTLFLPVKSTLFSSEKSTLFKQKTPPNPPKGTASLETKVQPAKLVQI